MRTIQLAIIIPAVSGFGILMTVLLISAPNQITVKTDWPSYAGSEPISVSGEVNSVIPGAKVVIQIFYPNGKLYNSSSVSLIDATNLYEYKFSIKPLGYGTSKVFTVRATYEGRTASTTFEYGDNRNPGLALLPPA